MWRERLVLHKTNGLQRLYPSCKFLLVCLYSVCSLIISGIGVTIGSGQYPLYLVLWFLIVPILSAASGIWKKFWKAFSKVVMIAAIILVVQSLLIPSEVVLWKWWILHIYQEGLRSGITLGFSVMNIAGIFIWMFQTTENKEISRALEDSGVNYKVAYVFISTLQMIEVLGKNSRAARPRRRNRGQPDRPLPRVLPVAGAADSRRDHELRGAGADARIQGLRRPVRKDPSVQY